MIREIKKKQSKFGTIISSFVEGLNTPDEAANLESMNAFSAFVAIHTLSKLKQPDAAGVTYVTQKTGPKLKQAIGNYISQIRGDQIVAFVRPSTKFLEDIARVFLFAERNRMERAYGFYVGNPNNPEVVAFTAAIIPHLFHVVPDQMDMIGDDWINYLHKWAPKAMMSHRYFDANELVAIAVPEKVPAASYSLAPDQFQATVPNEVIEIKGEGPVVVVKAKPGRKKAKK